MRAGATPSAPALSVTVPAVSVALAPYSAAAADSLASATPTTTRTVYFSELYYANSPNPDFYVTVDSVNGVPTGAAPIMFDASLPPAVVTTVGAIEDWTIQNRARETHVFHIHQVACMYTYKYVYACMYVPLPM